MPCEKCGHYSCCWLEDEWTDSFERRIGVWGLPKWELPENIRQEMDRITEQVREAHEAIGSTWLVDDSEGMDDDCEEEPEEVEEDPYDSRASALADECGRLRDENTKLLAENSRLRRKLGER